MTAPFIDIHTHRDGRAIADEGKLSCCHGFTYGIHPWWLAREGYDPEPDLRRLEGLLQRDQLAAIGEAGIDKPCGASLDLQAEVFGKHILLSEQYGKPLVIHQVKGVETVLRLHRQRQPRQAWILHGFNGSAEEALQLTGRGIYLSVGAGIMFKNRKIVQSIKSIPLDHLFFETDTADLDVQVIYAQASTILELPMEVLKEKIFANFARINHTTWQTGKIAPDCSSATMAWINLERATF